MAKWREFEQLVERLEAHNLPPGAILKSPDRVKCLKTGRLREVDVTIQLSINQGSKLITIECRDRPSSSAEDVTWIEQLITKKRNLGAVVTIVISSTGFTDTAVQMAANEGILLRTIDDIAEDEIDSWVGRIRMRSWYIQKIPDQLGMFDSFGQRISRKHIPTRLRIKMIDNQMEPFLVGEVTGRRESMSSFMQVGLDREYPTNISRLCIPRHPEAPLRKSFVMELYDDWYFVIGAKKKIIVRYIQIGYSLSMLQGEGTVFKVIHYGGVGGEKSEFSIVQIDLDNGESITEAVPRQNYDLLAKSMGR